MKSFSKDSPEFKMMADYYTFIKEFWEVKDTKEYWVSLVEKAEAFIKKYEADTKGLSRRLAYAFMCHCEQIYYDSRQDAQNKRSAKKKGADDNFNAKTN